MRTPKGNVLSVEYDRLRDRWRVDPGGYERRTLADALAQATGNSRNANWINELAKRLLSETSA